MHYCFNVVTKKDSDISGAVLIRAIQPQQGIKSMIKNRKTDNISNLANGPGKLTQAMQITLKQYNLDLTKNSSLALAIGYMDIVATIGGISLMQTGKEMETMIIVLLVYLLCSLFISLLMNLYNRSIRIKDR